MQKGTSPQIPQTLKENTKDITDNFMSMNLKMYLDCTNLFKDKTYQIIIIKKRKPEESYIQ